MEIHRLGSLRTLGAVPSPQAFIVLNLASGTRNSSGSMQNNPYRPPIEASAKPLLRGRSRRSFVILNFVLVMMLVAVPIVAWIEVRVEMAKLPPTYNGDPVTYQTTFHAPAIPSLLTLVFYLAIPNGLLMVIHRFRSSRRSG